MAISCTSSNLQHYLCLSHSGHNSERWNNRRSSSPLISFMSLLSVPTCSHLHVTSQGADPPLTSSTGQEDGDDGQQGADSQQSTAAWTQHRTGLRTKHTDKQTERFHLSSINSLKTNPKIDQKVPQTCGICCLRRLTTVPQVLASACGHWQTYIFDFLLRSYESSPRLKILPSPRAEESVCFGQVRLHNLTLNPPNRLMVLSARKQPSTATQQDTVPSHYTFA